MNDSMHTTRLRRVGRSVMLTVPPALLDLLQLQPGTMNTLDRITQKPEVMGGKPCIRGQRVTVGMIVGQIAAGAMVEELLTDYPYLEREDITQALRYAAWRAEEREVTLTSA